jgi:cell division protein FtsQ
MAVTAPADKRYKRAHLKPSRKHAGWIAKRWRVFAVALAVAAGGFAAQRALTSFAGLPVFQVRRIAVHGNRRMSKGEVDALLEGLRGESILTVNLEAWRRSVLNSPWVAEASLRRTLPSTVDVTIQERAPLGIGRINGSLYLVDERGTVIDDYGPNYADLDLPIIDGLSWIPGDTNPDQSRAALARRLMDALRVRNMSSRVSQIDVSDARNAIVLLDGDPTAIRLGNERFVERLQAYFDLAPALREQVPNIDYVDLRFDERVYVRPAGRKAAGASIAARPPVVSPQKRGRRTAQSSIG